MLRYEQNRCSARDLRVAAALRDDPNIVDRLLEQALASLQAPKRDRDL
jgi:hypothetical protein